MELASGWIRSDASIRAALVQASTARDEEKHAVLGAKVARDAALGEAANARGRCEVLEGELKGLQDRLAEETRLRQEQEEGMKAREAAIKDRDAKLRCEVLEGELKGLQDRLAEETRLRQEQEEGMKAREAAIKDRDAKLKKRRDRLGALEQELEARKVELDGKARVLAEDRVAFAEMEGFLPRIAWPSRRWRRRLAPR